MVIEYNIEKELLSERDIGPTVFRLYSGRIYHVIIKKGERATMDVVQEGYKFLDEHGGGLFFNLYEFNSFSDVDPEVREWAASPSNNSYTQVDAIVINGFAQKLLADFYIRFNKPVKPTRFFSTVKDAMNWIEEMQRSRE